MNHPSNDIPRPKRSASWRALASAVAGLLFVTSPLSSRAAEATYDLNTDHASQYGGDISRRYLDDEVIGQNYTSGPTTDHMPRGSIKNGYFQRWLWCGTACWLILNDVDKEILILDGYVSKAVTGNEKTAHYDPDERDQLFRITLFANLLRWLTGRPESSEDTFAARFQQKPYKIVGVLTMHNHSDHTMEVPVLFHALQLPEGGFLEFDAGKDGDTPMWSDSPLKHPPLTAEDIRRIPVVGDVDSFSGDIMAPGWESPLTHSVRFLRSFYPASFERTMWGASFGMSKGLFVKGSDPDPLEYVECSSCERPGNFRLGNFEITAYVWDHTGGGTDLAIDIPKLERQRRTLAFRIFHAHAPNAKVSFVNGSGGAFSARLLEEGDLYWPQHNRYASDWIFGGIAKYPVYVFGDQVGNPHEGHALYRAPGEIPAGEPVTSRGFTHGAILADMVFWAPNMLGYTANNPFLWRQNIRALGRLIKFNPDETSGPGYLLLSHHDENESPSSHDLWDTYDKFLEGMYDTGLRRPDLSWRLNEPGSRPVEFRTMSRYVIDDLYIEDVAQMVNCETGDGNRNTDYEPCRDHYSTDSNNVFGMGLVPGIGDCSPIAVGSEWHFVESCTITDTLEIDADVRIKNGATVTLAGRGHLKMDFGQHNLRIERTSRVVIRDRGRLGEG